jgi:hypothetical protein
MRQTALCLARVLSAGESHIVCTLDASPNFEPGGEIVSVYLRPAATDALALTATAALNGDPRLRAACTSMATLDEQCRELFCISWEGLLATPHATLRTLADHLKVVLSDVAWQAVDREITTLRDVVGRYDHPLAFVTALNDAPQHAAWTDKGLFTDTDAAAISHSIGVDVPRNLLLVTRSGDTSAPDAVATYPDWQIVHLAIGDDASLAAADASLKLGMIFFHGIEAAPEIGALLDSLVPRLADGGLLFGEEASGTAVSSAVAKLTGDGDRHALTFMLSEHRWLAFPPAWWR